MAVVRKFLFDNDFGAAPQNASVAAAAGKTPAQAGGAKGNAARADAPPAAPMFSEAEMQGACDMARRQGEETGVARGKSEAVAVFDKQVAATLAAIAQQVSAIATSTASEVEAAGKSIDLALAISRKLFPALSERHGIDEIAGVLAHCLASLKQEPRLVAYVNNAQLDALQAKLAQLTGATGFEGRVVLIGDEKLAETDCRVEWADGGVERDSVQIWRAIEETLTRYLAIEDREPA